MYMRKQKEEVRLIQHPWYNFEISWLLWLGLYMYMRKQKEEVRLIQHPWYNFAIS